MRKISAMYQYSGGTNYRRTCGECRNCIRVAKGKRSVYKCLAYGNTASNATDWKISYVACRAFDRDPPKIPVFKSGTGMLEEESQFEGQISIFDFVEGEDG